MLGAAGGLALSDRGRYRENVTWLRVLGVVFSGRLLVAMVEAIAASGILDRAPAGGRFRRCSLCLAVVGLCAGPIRVQDPGLGCSAGFPALDPCDDGISGLNLFSGRAFWV